MAGGETYVSNSGQRKGTEGVTTPTEELSGAVRIDSPRRMTSRNKELTRV